MCNCTSGNDVVVERDPGLFILSVIVREGGRSSTPRALDSISGAGDYWMPAFAGMTGGEAIPAFFYLVIASVAKQSITTREGWIASSLRSSQ
jgi:hypothetical protein